MRNNNSEIAILCAYNGNEKKTGCQYSNNFIRIVMNYNFFLIRIYTGSYNTRVHFSERFSVSDITRNTMRFH